MLQIRENVVLTTGLEKWSSARPRSMVRSELWVLVPGKTSDLASKLRQTWHKTPFFLQAYTLCSGKQTQSCSLISSTWLLTTQGNSYTDLPLKTSRGRTTAQKMQLWYSRGIIQQLLAMYNSVSWQDIRLLNHYNCCSPGWVNFEMLILYCWHIYMFATSLTTVIHSAYASSFLLCMNKFFLR